MDKLDQPVVTSSTAPKNSLSTDPRTTLSLIKKLRGGVLFVVGFMLSPLSWWNDLVFNLPVAYGFGYLCSWFSPNWLIPGTVMGYWLSNLIGILLMQAGVLDLAQGQVGDRNLKKELLAGLASSTVYTLVIVGLLQFKILETPVLFASEQLSQLNSWLPW